MSRGSPLSPRNELRQAEQAEAEREAKEAEGDRVLLASILKRDIDWSGFEANGFISKKEAGLFLDYDKQKKEDQNDLLQEKGLEYAAVFIKALDAIRAKDTVEYLIVTVDQLLSADPSRAKYFHLLAAQPVPAAQAQQNAKPLDPYAPFLRILNSTEQNYHAYIINRSCIILAILLATAPQASASPSSSITQHSTTSFLRYLINKLNSASSSARDQISALSALKPLLQSSATQLIFITQLDGITALSTLLTKNNTNNAQLIYTIGFNLWLLSYNLNACQLMLDKGAMKRIVSILKSQSMEKVIRICTSIVYNIVHQNDHLMNEALIGLGLLTILETLNKRKFKDTDINPDMNEIIASLQSTIQQLSTYDMYVSEVISGNLNWSPAHKNEIFWRENIGRFEERNYAIIAKLIDLLADDDDTIREIACYDLGEFARFAPEGKRVITKLGGKNKLMVNLAHKNPKVAKAALLATQKLMVANWEFLAKSSSGGVGALAGKGGAGAAARKE